MCPAVTAFTFTLDDGAFASGTFDYTDSQINASLPSQQLTAHSINIAINGQPVSLDALWSAPKATFSNGQLRGVAFAYDVTAGNYDFLAVGDTVATAVTLAGDLTQGAVSLTGVPPLTPIPNAPIDLTQLDPTAAIAAFNANVAGLAPLVARIQEEMAAYDALVPLIKDMRVKERFGATPADREAAKKMGDALYAKWSGYFLSIGGLSEQYNTRFDTLVAQDAFLRNLLTFEQQLQLSSIPNRYDVPTEYTIPPAGMV